MSLGWCDVRGKTCEVPPSGGQGLQPLGDRCDSDTSLGRYRTGVRTGFEPLGGLTTLGIDTSTLLQALVVHWLGRASYKDVNKVQFLAGVQNGGYDG